MIDHVVIPVRDLDVSRRFYEPLFGHPGRGPDLIMQAPTLILRAAVGNPPSRGMCPSSPLVRPRP